MDCLPKFFGKVPVGSKGQIVIPAEARKALGIKAGDKVIIVSGPHLKKTISVISEVEFNKFFKFFEKSASKLK
jgi:AbrB family looped-hinge helix DNA binding protein